ncbi:MAG: tetratricopeptide repeat protein [Opitutae bacterium]|nr:tetratricopeptide repeat protein [Opitutae bacterium]
MTRPALSQPLFPRLRPVLALLGAAALAVTLGAQQPARDYSLTDATQEALPKFKTAADAKNYDAALAILDAQLAKVPLDSYDAATLYQIKVQTLFQKGDFSKAIEPMEQALALSEAKTPTYFEERVTRELFNFLTQLYVQDAVQSKNPALAAKLFEKADRNMQKWLKLTPQSTADGQLLYSQLLYTWAVLDPNKPDLKLIQRALDETERGLHLAIRPKDTFYVLKLAALQQLNRMTETAEMFELLIKQKPESPTYYPQLAGTYLGTGQDLRAAMTIERAQAHGHMNTPQYHYNLVGIYFNLGQFEKAADLLESGLKSGKIENELKNWELYALCYQQLERPLKSIEVLKAAAKVFPKSGQLEFNIGQAYHGLDKSEDALVHLQAAVDKGGLSKPHQAHMFLAYVAYELKKFDQALDAAKKALETPEGAKDPQTKSMIKAIEETIKERAEKKAKL